MFLAKASLFFVVATLAAIFCAQSVEAARGPRVTNKVYFDIKHGDKDLGRGTFPFTLTVPFNLSQRPFASFYSHFWPFRWCTLSGLNMY